MSAILFISISFHWTVNRLGNSEWVKLVTYLNPLYGYRIEKVFSI